MLHPYLPGDTRERIKDLLSEHDMTQEQLAEEPVQDEVPADINVVDMEEPVFEETSVDIADNEPVDFEVSEPSMEEAFEIPDAETFSEDSVDEPVSQQESFGETIEDISFEDEVPESEIIIGGVELLGD